MLSGAHHQVTWTARTHCLVRVMDRRCFQHLLTAEPSVRDHALRYLCVSAIMLFPSSEGLTIT